MAPIRRAICASSVLHSAVMWLAGEVFRLARIILDLTEPDTPAGRMLSQHAHICAVPVLQMRCSMRAVTAVSAASARTLSTYAARRQQAAFEFGTSSTTAPAAGQQPLRLILLGAPGAGKGTQTDSLLRKFHLCSLVVGNLLRDEVVRQTDVGIKAAKVMREGGLLDNETILQVVKPGLKRMNGQDWILVSMNDPRFTDSHTIRFLSIHANGIYYVPPGWLSTHRTTGS